MVLHASSDNQVEKIVVKNLALGLNSIFYLTSDLGINSYLIVEIISAKFRTGAE